MREVKEVTATSSVALMWQLTGASIQTAPSGAEITARDPETHTGTGSST